MCVVQVQVPSQSGGEAKPGSWNLNGQIISIELSYSDKVELLKEKIESATGVPANRQRLKIVTSGITVPFLKDHFSLAFYNISGDSVVQLALKERGGRK